MQTTKSILCLWVGSSAFACFEAYGLAYHQGAMAVIVGQNLDLGGGPSFALGFPSLAFFVLALVCAVVAAVSFLLSWRLNKQRFFSLPHVAALFFVVPLGIALLWAMIVAA
jgi:hypothetical protein